MSAIANTPRSRFSGSANARRHASQARVKRRRPMGEMNVTPFIDVLLVLLIMLIMAVPIKVHETTVDLPSTECLDCVLSPVTNTVAITAHDRLLWNGTTVTPEQLSTLITRASRTLPEAQLHFEPDAQASYDRSARTIALIKGAGAKSFAFVGNAKYREFGR